MKYKITLLLVVSLLASCTSSPSPILPAAKLSPVKNEFTVTKRWSTKLGEGVGDQYLKLSPVIADGIIYIADYTGQVGAYNIETQKEIWVVELNIPISGGLSLVEDSLLLGTSKGELVRLKKKDGDVVWKAQLSSEILSVPQGGSNVVVARCVDGQLFGIDMNSGEQLWIHTHRTPRLTLRGVSSPVIANDIVLASFDDGTISAFNLKNGRVLWQSTIAVPQGRTDIERLIDADANPVVVNDIVYAVTYQGRLVALQLGSGRVVWTKDLSSYSGMSIDPARVYVTGSNGEVLALDRFSGATIWRQDALLQRGVTQARLHGSYVVVGDFMGYLHWMRRDTGKLVARIRMNDSSYAQPALVEPDPGTLPRARNILIPPLAVGSKLLVTDRHGNVEMFDIQYN